MVDKTRRNYIFAGLGLGAVLAAAGLRPGDKGAAHQPYFNRLSNALDGAGAAQPSLVVDKTLMLENVKT
ncbi:MAG: hypothetical protein OIF38_05355, partial [Cellvibrionaceae bacterium]|nr:hypothetical protein [Cellvibrionaceae bacterium]